MNFPKAAPGRRMLVGLAWAVAALAKEQQPALGLVLASQSAQVSRLGISSRLNLKPGDVLFAGDVITTPAAGSARVLYCPQKSVLRLEAEGRFKAERGRLNAMSGRIAVESSASSCWLANEVRVEVASRQHFATSLVRPLDSASVASGNFEQRMAQLDAADQAALKRELDALRGADAATHAQRAALFERYGLRFDAVSEYRRILQQWPDAEWVMSRLFDLEEPRQEAAAPAVRAGRTYALLVGISDYQSDRISPLAYAARDAELFRDFLLQPRGGGLAQDDIVLLTGKQATTAAIRLAIADLFTAKAKPGDTVILYLGAHGTIQPRDGKAYVVTYDADPEDLGRTALPMADLQEIKRQDPQGRQRLLVYLDSCHAGKLGEVPIRTMESAAEPLAARPETFTFLASGKDEVAQEGPQFGGGHGAFSFFVVDGLNGSADEDGNGLVDFNEFVDYVRAMVKRATARRQNPREIGDLGRTTVMSDKKNAGMELAKWNPGETVVAGLVRTRSLAVGGDILQAYDDAIAKKRLLPGPGSASNLLPSLRKQLGPREYQDQENRLRTALEDEGQQVILRYLKGEQAPQTRDEFVLCASYFGAAAALTPESLLLASRKAFCEGRAALFDARISGAYAPPVKLLEHAIRLDPSAAHSFNALGIGYLELGEFNAAADAFRDAIARAPYWAYPRHNLALAFSELGRYREAVATYQEAARLAPRYAYLRHNLGLVLQRMNRPKEAEAALREAIRISPELPEPYNALGFLYASAGRAEAAERFYRDALARRPGWLEARHNLAVMLAGTGNRPADAERLWRENIAQDPDYLPSQLSLARYLADSGRARDAIEHFRAVLLLRDDYAAARASLARALLQAGDAKAALAETSKLPRSAEALEIAGDAHSALGDAPAARDAYTQALRLRPESDVKKRIDRKVRSSGVKR